MGYTIIQIDEGGKLKSTYINDLKELVDLSDINEDTIIVDGTEEAVKPLKEYSDYKQYYGDFKAGKKAEMKFYEIMTKNGYFIEQIDQSKESFQKYKDESEEYQVKRPDFVVLGHNICFEIKCYHEKNYKLAYKEHKRLERFQDKTNMDVYLIVFQKDGDDIALNEKKEPIYFIIKNDDVYTTDKRYFNKKVQKQPAQYNINPTDRKEMAVFKDIIQFMKQLKQ